MDRLNKWFDKNKFEIGELMMWAGILVILLACMLLIAVGSAVVLDVTAYSYRGRPLGLIELFISLPYNRNTSGFEGIYKTVGFCLVAGVVLFLSGKKIMK